MEGRETDTPHTAKMVQREGGTREAGKLTSEKIPHPYENENALERKSMTKCKTAIIPVGQEHVEYPGEYMYLVNNIMADLLSSQVLLHKQ